MIPRHADRIKIVTGYAAVFIRPLYKQEMVLILGGYIVEPVHPIPGCLQQKLRAAVPQKRFVSGQFHILHDRMGDIRRNVDFAAAGIPSAALLEAGIRCHPGKSCAFG